jgi:hypothetical protein
MDSALDQQVCIIASGHCGATNETKTEKRGSAGEYLKGWLPPRDSNPDTLLQRQVSYR